MPSLSLSWWRERARRLKRETYALSLACRDRRTPWYAKALAVAIVAYAVSPIDLVPDVIPVLGLLDDLLLLPLAILLAIKLIPDEVMAECRQRAEAAVVTPGRAGRVAAAAVVAIWALVAVLVGVAFLRLVS